MKRVMVVFGYALLIYALLVGAVFLAQRSMMYFPSKQKPDISEAGIKGLEEIVVQTKDGLSLYGWYAKPARAGKPAIVWFHGNASNVLWASGRLIPFVEAGYGVLFVEYRGYNGNPGKPTEQGLYNDARAFIDWLKQNGTDENSIILYGESIGSGIAVQMATEYPSINALILEAPFTSATDVAAAAYWFLPVRMMLKDRYDNLSKIGKTTAPLILIHGDRDAVVPYALGERLFNAAPEPKSMITVEGGGHNDLGNFGVADKVLSLLSE